MREKTKRDGFASESQSHVGGMLSFQPTKFESEFTNSTNAQLVEVSPTPRTRLKLIIHQLSLVGFAEAYELLCRLTLNNPPTYVGGISDF